MTGKLLSSDWGNEYGLNQNLIAKIYPVNDKGDYIPDGNTVAAPLTDANLEVSLNWQSPFENTGADSFKPAIAQLLQTGQAGVLLNLLASFLPDDPDGKSATFQKNIKNLANQANSNTGLTGITQLNSRQVFTGLPPLKLPVTMYFRAWRNPKEEVESPVDQLFQWALPQELARDSVLVNIIEDLKKGTVDLHTIFPSKIPQFVALEYGGRTWKPLVIEAISQPLVLPRDSNGAMLSVSVQLTLATLNAWDKTDWARSAGLNSRIGVEQFLTDSGF